MSLTGKYTTLYSVIERIKRDGINDFTEEEAKEWVWEVISLIGEPKHFVDKVAVINIEEARGYLPHDLYDLTEGGVRDYYSKIILIKEGSIYYDPQNVGEGNNKLMYQSDGESIVYIDGIQQDEDVDTYLGLLPPYFPYPREKGTYKINDGFLFTGFKTGAVELAYKAFPIDNEYNPMIEDNYKVIRAVTAYIKKKVINRMWLRDEVQDKKKQAFDQEYSFAVAAARSDASIGSVDDWEEIRSRLIRLRRDPNLHRIGFEGYGVKEGLNLDGYNNSSRNLI